MRAVIIATDHHAESHAFGDRFPSVMLPLVDRPFIQHLIEYLIDRKITEFDLILSHLPEKIEAFLGDGARWGSTFRYHLVRDPQRPYGALKAIDLEADSQVLFAHADRLVQVSADHLTLAAWHGKPSPFCYQNAGDSADDLRWTGWACVTGRSLAAVFDNADEQEAGRRLIESARVQNTIVKVDAPLSVVSYDELLESQLRVLTRQFSGLVLSGKEAEKGIWVSRNVSLDPTARLVSPIFIGENCRIARGIHLGPNAVVGNDCVFDSRCTVSNSLILSGSYVGEALELCDVIVDKNRLVNVRMGAAVSISDAFILGSIRDNHIKRHLSGFSSRFIAAMLLTLCWPALLITGLFLKLFRHGPVVFRTEVVGLPIATSEWRTFELLSFINAQSEMAGLKGLFLVFLPALMNVARGELRFVGVASRTTAQIKAMPVDWKALYLHSKAGIVTEAFVNYGTSPTDDELYTAEAFYAAAGGLKHDLRLMRKYLVRVLKESSGSGRRRLRPDAGVIPARVK